MNTRIIIGCDIRIYLDGIVGELEKHSDLECVGKATDSQQLLALVRAGNTDVAIIDMAMADSINTIQLMREINPDLKTIALTFSNTDEQVLSCAQSGVAGFVSREDTLSDLIDCISAVISGETRCPSATAEKLMRLIANSHADKRPGKAPAGLTIRQMKVLELIEQGLSNKQISSKLRIEVATVKNHVHSILQKLHVENRGEAAAYFRRTNFDYNSQYRHVS